MKKLLKKYFQNVEYWGTEMVDGNTRCQECKRVFPPQAITEWDSKLQEIVFRNWKNGDEVGMFTDVKKLLAEAEQRGEQTQIDRINVALPKIEQEARDSGAEAERSRIREVIYKDGVPEKYYKNSEQFRAGFSTALDYLLDLINKKDE